jgi:hypothetical protein
MYDGLPLLYNIISLSLSLSLSLYEYEGLYCHDYILLKLALKALAAAIKLGCSVEPRRNSPVVQ